MEKKVIETSLTNEVEYMLNRIAILFNTNTIHDRFVTIQGTSVYIELSFDSLTLGIKRDVVVYNKITGDSIKIGYYVTNLKEKVEAAIMLLTLSPHTEQDYK